MLGKWAKLESSTNLQWSSHSVTLPSSKGLSTALISHAGYLTGLSNFCTAGTPSPRAGSAMAFTRGTLYCFSACRDVVTAPLEEECLVAIYNSRGDVLGARTPG